MNKNRLIAITIALFSSITLISQAALAQTYFGAIAYSPSTGSDGFSYDYGTQRDAEMRAHQECINSGGSADCKVVIWFRNACGALAVANDGTYGSGWGSDKGIAETYAIQTCNDYGGRGCKIIRWACTSK